MNNRAMLLVNDENEKALHEQGHTLSTKIPTKAQRKEVQGDYQAFKDVAINCLQFINREPRHASLRVTRCDRHGKSIRIAINGRAGRSDCHLVSAEQVNDLIERLTQLKFGLVVAENRGKS